MNQDREILRGLAGKVAEIAASDRMKKLEGEWKRHNALQGERPMICVSPEGCWREIIREEDLQCQDPLLRSFEYSLRQKIFWAEEIQDDTPISANFGVPHIIHSTFYLDAPDNNQVRVSDTGSFHYTKLIDDLEEGLEKLKFRRITYDCAASEAGFAAAQEAFGDLLNIRYRGSHWWTMGITAEVIRLIGLEDLMIDMYDDPDNLHRLMAWFRDEHMNLITQCENLGILTLNNEDDIIASGGIGYTDELKSENGQVTLQDLWGFAESQETVGISPQMFGEFIFPYQLPLLEKFGINCYGCCEPVECRWEWIKQIPRLRRLSVSPWSNKEEMADLLGKNYIFSRKPNPAYVCVGFAEDEIRRDLTETAQLADRIHLEVILKDTHTVENHPERLHRWVKTAREILG
ncbi:MAG: hypothetical protein ACI4GO_02150 [Hominenteromicrobium sp.]